MRPVNVPEAAPFFFHRGSTGALLLHGFTSTPFEVRELGERLAEAGITAPTPTTWRKPRGATGSTRYARLYMSCASRQSTSS